MGEQIIDAALDYQSWQHVRCRPRLFVTHDENDGLSGARGMPEPTAVEVFGSMVIRMTIPVGLGDAVRSKYLVLASDPLPGCSGHHCPGCAR